jgi:cbb3-type cytochrome oxidase subunit 3
MMKIENIIDKILTALLFYCIIEISFKVFNQSDSKYLLIIPFWVNSLHIFIFGLISLTAGCFFPLWKVNNYFSNFDKRLMDAFKNKYKKSYYLNSIGFFCVLTLSGSKIVLDFYFLLGFVLIIIFLIYICFFLRIKKKNIIKKKYNGLQILAKDDECNENKNIIDFYSYHT